MTPWELAIQYTRPERTVMLPGKVRSDAIAVGLPPATGTLIGTSQFDQYTCPSATARYDGLPDASRVGWPPAFDTFMTVLPYEVVQ
jgi:hypothetical protein